MGELAKPEQVVYYKVLYSENGLLYSAVNTSHTVKYKTDEWVYPIIGKLFVFDSLENAKNFARRFYVIYECEVVNPTIATCRALFDIELFWIYRRNTVYQVPRGTYYADAVKITKIIQ